MIRAASAGYERVLLVVFLGTDKVTSVIRTASVGLKF